MTELAVVRRADLSEKNLLTLVLGVWTLSYLVGFHTGQKLTRKPGLWRLPYLLTSLMLAIAALITGSSDTLPYLTLAYAAASLAMGIYTSTSTSVVFNTLSYEQWNHAAATLRGLAGLIYGVFLLLIIYYTPSSIPHIVSSLGLSIAGIIVLAVAASVRLPAVPETLLRQLDMAVDGMAFGSSGEPLQGRVVGSVALLVGVGVLARILTVRRALTYLDPGEVLTLYATLYLLGSLLGIRRPSPGLAALGALLMVSLMAATANPIVEVVVCLLYSSYIETALISYVLSVSPLQLSQATATAALALALSAVLLFAALAVGLMPEHVFLALSLIALITQYRRPSWY